MKMYESISFRRTRHSSRRFGEQDELDEEVADADRRRQPRDAIDDAEERRLGAEQDARPTARRA